MPIASSRLTLQQSLVVDCLIDSGATINVLPRTIGLQLGAVWDQQQFRIPLGGVLAGREAKAVFVDVEIGTLPSVQLAFAWVDSDDVPVLFGQVNFFQEFDVCLFRSRGWFEIGRRK